MSVPEFKISDRAPGLGGPIIYRVQEIWCECLVFTRLAQSRPCRE